MNMMKHIQTWLLITLLALSANGAVSAKVASGPQNLSGGAHQSQTDLKALLHQGLEEVSTTDVSGSPLATKNTGDLTKAEIKQIQGVVNEAGRPLEVVGSAAKGTRRGVGSNLPIGKGPGTRSDTDFTTAGANIDNFKGLESKLPNADPKTPILRGAGDTNQGPVIRFEPE